MRKIEVVLADDLDGTVGAETVEFSLQGEKFTLDLSKKHRSELQRSMKRFIDAARRTQNGAPAHAAATPEERKVENARIRDWAIEHGKAVPKRGRLPKAILDEYAAYEANHTNVG